MLKDQAVAIGTEPAVAERISTVTGTPSLALGDTFLPFQPGLFGYAIDRGALPQRDVFFNFGSSTRVVFPPLLDIAPHDDVPDHKMRVRITLSDTDPLQDPSGDIIVHGMVYERDWDDPLGGVLTSVPVSAPALHFISNGTMTTSTYFDEVTSIETPGLGMNAKLEVELWDGHEQEMQVGVRIDGIGDEVTCENDWRVYFNGQVALPEWDADASTCSAGLLPHGAARGMYFGLVKDEDEEDAFHHFVNAGPDATVPHGHISPPKTWESWLAGLPAGRSFWLVDENGTDETRIRPIVVELERQSDLQVVDAARMMLTIAEGAFGQPSLVAKLAGVENPGAIAQLSPRGLDRLEPTHASTLPYPIVPAGTQPRLSQSAIAKTEHTSAAVDVDLDDLPDEDLDYWTKPNPAPQPNVGEFAGYLAYQDILGAARRQKTLFDALINSCESTPNPVACKAGFQLSFCVEDDPEESDFRIHIDGVDTYFDPVRTQDALVIGNVTGMDLSFGSDQILSDYTLENIQGWLLATIDPAKIQIEWDKSPIDPCTIKPAAIPLSDYIDDDAVDYADWLVCDDLSFSASSGTLADPLAFDVAKNGESIETPLASGTPNVNLAGVAALPGIGVCEQDWLAPTIETEILNWQADVESTIAVELATSPGQDEALNRLLSPYELGIERVDTPPAGTPSYDVHPLATYDLSATIGKTAADTFGAHSNATDGLYLPYMTRSSPTDAVPFLTWFCPSPLCGELPETHRLMLEGGLDPDGVVYDVTVNYTTAHINQALWAQARRQDHLGSPNFPARLTLSDTAIVDLASSLGFTDVVDALTPLGTRFGVRYYQQAAPYTLITDGVGFMPPKLLYVIPNIVVELVSIAGDGTEAVVAKFLVDVVDRDLQVTFSTGGIPELTASWGQRSLVSVTSTHVPDCYWVRTSLNNCDARLRLVLGALWWPQVEEMLLDMIERTPALQLFDAGGESSRPRHLKNVRTFLLNQGLGLVGDLCKPATLDCPVATSARGKVSAEWHTLVR